MLKECAKKKARVITMKITVKGKKEGKSKKQWIVVVEEDMRRRGLQQELAKKRQ